MKTSNTVTTKTSLTDNFNVSWNEFHDAYFLTCYLCKKCDGFPEEFMTQHALACVRVGLASDPKNWELFSENYKVLQEAKYKEICFFLQKLWKEALH